MESASWLGPKFWPETITPIKRWSELWSTVVFITERKKKSWNFFFLLKFIRSFINPIGENTSKSVMPCSIYLCTWSCKQECPGAENWCAIVWTIIQRNVAKGKSHERIPILWDEWIILNNYICNLISVYLKILLVLRLFLEYESNLLYMRW